jgi:hypothetical protein
MSGQGGADIIVCLLEIRSIERFPGHRAGREKGQERRFSISAQALWPWIDSKFSLLIL